MLLYYQLKFDQIFAEEFSAHAGARVESLRLGRKSGRVLVTGGEDKKVNVWAIGKSNAVMVCSFYMWWYYKSKITNTHRA